MVEVRRDLKLAKELKLSEKPKQFPPVKIQLVPQEIWAERNIVSRPLPCRFSILKVLETRASRQNLISLSPYLYCARICPTSGKLFTIAPSEHFVVNMLGINEVDSMDTECSMMEKSPKKNITVTVEGNIGSGKTTLLNYFRKNPMVEVLEEPVANWQNVGGKNLLELFYTNCQRWSYLFESYAVLSLMKIHKKPHVTPVKMIERSVYSGYYCFEHNLCKSGMMSSAEHSVHHEWFDWITKRQQPQLDLIIYLRTSPETCMQRIKARSRTEEKTLPMELLCALHERHEEWLIQEKFPVPAPVMVVDGNRNLEEMMQFYRANNQYLLGMEKWPHYHSVQEAVC